MTAGDEFAPDRRRAREMVEAIRDMGGTVKLLLADDVVCDCLRERKLDDETTLYDVLLSAATALVDSDLIGFMDRLDKA